MPRIIGRLTKLGLGKESSRGTAVAPTYWIPVEELGFEDKIELKDNESGFGSISAINASNVVKRWGEGDYAGKIFDRSVGLELTALFGQSPTSVQRGATGVYDHSYSMLQTNQHQSVTAAVADDNYSGRFALGMINTWSFESEVGDYVRRTVNLISKGSASSSETVAYTDENEFTAKDIVLKMAAVGSNDATIDAATAIKARSVSFEIAKNAEALQVLGTNEIDDVVNKQLEITGEFEMYYDNRTYHDLAAAGTHQAFRVEILNNDITIGVSGTNKPALRFQFSEIAMEFPERGFDANDINTITIPFRAMLNVTAGSEVTARLTNAYAGTNY